LNILFIIYPPVQNLDSKQNTNTSVCQGYIWPIFYFFSKSCRFIQQRISKLSIAG